MDKKTQESQRNLTSILYNHNVNRGKRITSESFMRKVISLAGKEGKTVEGKFSFNIRNTGDGSAVERISSFTDPDSLRDFEYIENTKYDEINPSSQEIFEDMADNMKIYSGNSKFFYDGAGNFRIV